jgi:hypothetical protein
LTFRIGDFVPLAFLIDLARANDGLQAARLLREVPRRAAPAARARLRGARMLFSVMPRRTSASVAFSSSLTQRASGGWRGSAPARHRMENPLVRLVGAPRVVRGGHVRNRDPLLYGGEWCRMSASTVARTVQSSARGRHHH